MKRYIRCSNEKITDNYLNELFKNIDWDDVDYVDRLIDRTIKKELGVDHIFSQAKYINMLDDNVKEDLMNLLKNPQAIHERRIKARKKKSHKSSNQKRCKLSVKFEDYPDGNLKKGTFEGNDRLEALKAMIEEMLLYIDTDQIEDDNMTASDVIDHLIERNGDGCDFIIELKDESTGETLMQYDYEEYEDL